MNLHEIYDKVTLLSAQSYVSSDKTNIIMNFEYLISELKKLSTEILDEINDQKGEAVFNDRD